MLVLISVEMPAASFVSDVLLSSASTNFVKCFLRPSSDHSKGFGGKFGVQKDRQDKSAAGYEEKTKTELHPSQTDMKKGFGGKFGVEDRKDEVINSVQAED